MTKCFIKKYIFLFGITAILIVFFFPQSARADILGDILNCGADETISLSGFLYLLVRIAQWILGITGSLALLMFVIGGFIWLLSGGSNKLVALGRTTLINALIGMGIVFGSWMFIYFILSSIGEGWVSEGFGTFNKTLCETGRSASLGSPATEPPAPPAPTTSEPPSPVTRTQEQTIEAKKNINCVTREAADLQCSQATKDGKVAKIVTVDGSGKNCKEGGARCEIITKGLACDVRYERPSTREHGCICRSDEIPTDIAATAKQKTKDGIQYLCCQCAKKATVLQDPQCGQSGASFEDFRKNKRTKCCEFKKGARDLKQICGTGKPIELKILTQKGCYCVHGSALCNIETGAGCSASKDPTWHYECKTEWDTQYEGADIFGKIAGGIMNIPQRAWSWAVGVATQTDQTGICVPIKN